VKKTVGDPFSGGVVRSYLDATVRYATNAYAWICDATNRYAGIRDGTIIGLPFGGVISSRLFGGACYGGRRDACRLRRSRPLLGFVDVDGRPRRDV
jgi:hypothetical protein